MENGEIMCPVWGIPKGEVEDYVCILYKVN